MTESRSLPRPDDRVDRYEVLMDVAHGGMATLFAVRRTGLGGFDKVLAMKVMLPNLCGERAGVEMFLDEGRIAAGIEHPNVVQVFDVGEWQGLPFLIMEFVRGQSLARIIRAAKNTEIAIPAAFSAVLLLKVAEGLHAAHESRDPDGELLGVVHRDVSPQNIMVSYAGDVKVLDFGVAAARGRIGSTRSGELKGKLGYVSPEVVTARQTADRRADVWALGVLGWELFAGRRLFRSEDDASTLWNVIGGEIAELGEIRPDLPTSLVDSIMACLKRDREERLASCAEIASGLRPAVEELGGWRREDLAKQMREWFAREEAVEEDRLRRASSVDDSLSEPSLGELSPAQLVPLEASTPPPALSVVPSHLSSARGTRWLLGGFAALVLGGAAAFVALRPYVASSATGSVSSTSPSTSASPAERLSLEIGDGVRMVLVDGIRHDERPLVIEMPAAGSATVELVGADGRVAHHAVVRADEGRTLSLPETKPSPSGSLLGSADAGAAQRPPARQPRPPARDATPAATKPKPAPLFDNPYQ